jgi:hypothetical protein
VVYLPQGGESGSYRDDEDFGVNLRRTHEAKDAWLERGAGAARAGKAEQRSNQAYEKGIMAARLQIPNQVR